MLESIRKCLCSEPAKTALSLLATHHQGRFASGKKREEMAVFAGYHVVGQLEDTFV